MGTKCGCNDNVHESSRRNNFIAMTGNVSFSIIIMMFSRLLHLLYVKYTVFLVETIYIKSLPDGDVATYSGDQTHYRYVRTTHC